MYYHDTDSEYEYPLYGHSHYVAEWHQWLYEDEVLLTAEHIQEAEDYQLQADIWMQREIDEWPEIMPKQPVETWAQYDRRYLILSLVRGFLYG